MAQTYRVLGLMSGTSMDGIDLAILVTDGRDRIERGPAGSVPYGAEVRDALVAAIAATARWRPPAPLPDEALNAERLVTDTYIEAIGQFLRNLGEEAASLDLIGFHGQTVLHAPEDRLTLQLGDAAALAKALGVPVVADFRLADVAAGGEGAPFAPLYHAALLKESAISLPAAVINLGGVANITVADEDGGLLAFDTGPGNALLDDWTKRHTGEPFDADGALASAGAANRAVLAKLMDHRFFDEPPPKSLDRNAFSLKPLEGLTPADGAATLVAFTAAALKASLAHLARVPRTWVACGGGRHNPAIMAALAEALPGTVMAAEEAGWRGDAIEAEAFAYLAVRSKEGLPLSLPQTTGVPEPMKGGTIYGP